jgi:type II secretory pathway component PulM
MRRVALAAVGMALLTAPAFAQFGIGGGGGERDRTRYTPEQRKQEAEVEKAYKDVMKNTRGAASETYDPWRNIRPATASETKNKPSR